MIEIATDYIAAAAFVFLSVWIFSYTEKGENCCNARVLQ